MKKIRRLLILMVLIFVTFVATSCELEIKDGSLNYDLTIDIDYQFQYWNECQALSELTAYIENVTDIESPNFIPTEDRIAVFDMDGTLCGELFPEYLEYLLLAYRCLDDPNYEASEELKEVANLIRTSGANYKTPDVPNFDLVHGNAQAKAFAGLTPDEFIAYVKDFLNQEAMGFEGLTYANSLYKPMIEVITYLRISGFTSYIVSGSDRMICRAVASEALDIPYNNIIGMDVNLVATNQNGKDGLNYQFNAGGDDQLVRGDELLIKNLKMNKVQQIVQEIGKQPVLSFGNSSGDVSMHEYTITNNKYLSLAFMLVADDYERDHADPIETNKRIALWEEAQYTIISMKNDFKTIYGYDVVKVD